MEFMLKPQPANIPPVHTHAWVSPPPPPPPLKTPLRRWLSTSVEEGGAGGLDWAKTNLQGHTVCHKAALKGHKALVEWLRQQTGEGVVPECAWGRDEGGYTPTDVAKLAGHVELAEWLERNGSSGS